MACPGILTYQNPADLAGSNDSYFHFN